MSSTEQIETWLSMLFEPEDIFEVRVKREDEKGAQQTWHSIKQSRQFATIIAPIHAKNRRHVWVGVCPREKRGSPNPTVARVLWVDLSASVADEDTLTDKLAESGLPDPTMIVWSGHGYHLYWKLEQAIPARDVRPYTKGVHDRLPSDATHDPQRVMRVPGTLNVKDASNPTECQIVRYSPENVYSIAQFPQAEIAAPTPYIGRVDKPNTPLTEEDFQNFVQHWVDGQKHHMAVGVAGYLRKTLGYNEEQCLAEIARIHEAAGYSMDENLRAVVRDTYSKPFATVAGLKKLQELGVMPDTRDTTTIRFGRPKRPTVSLVDMNEDIGPQEFWIRGLVGPGLLSIWAAEPKTGKSFAAMQIGQALATGSQLWDFECDLKPHRVLYFQGELSRHMVYERAKSMFGAGVIRDQSVYAMTDRPSEPIDLLRDPTVLTDIAADYDVIIVDPLAVFHTANESSLQEVTRVVNVFNQLRTDGKAVLAIHHTRKLDTDRNGNPLVPGFSDIRGSSGWFALADAIALQYRLNDQGTTRVKFVFRAAEERDPLTLYRLPAGGFTHEPRTYLSQRGFKVKLPNHLN